MQPPLLNLDRGNRADRMVCCSAQTHLRLARTHDKRSLNHHHHHHHHHHHKQHQHHHQSQQHHHHHHYHHHGLHGRMPA
eukprot:761235-Amphidinium_carterae.1